MNEFSFSIETKGSSGKEYAGVFKCKKRLTPRENLQRDALRRELLGASPDGASDLALGFAEAVSTIRFFIIDGPPWLKDSKFGLDLMDEEPIWDVYNAIAAERKKDMEELQAKAEKAREELKKP